MNARRRKIILLWEHIAKARFDKSLSREKVAIQSWVQYSTYLKIEKWETDNPNLKNITKIARVLELSLDEITRDMYLNDEF